MSWAKAAVSGRAPLAGLRHTATLVGERLYIRRDGLWHLSRHARARHRSAQLDVDHRGPGRPSLAHGTRRPWSATTSSSLVASAAVDRSMTFVVLHTVWRVSSSTASFGPSRGEWAWRRQRGGGAIAAAIVDTKVFFFGGHDGKACLNDVHVLVTMELEAARRQGRPTPTAARLVHDDDRRVEACTDAARRRRRP